MPTIGVKLTKCPQCGESAMFTRVGRTRAIVCPNPRNVPHKRLSRKDENDKEHQR